MTAHKKPLDTLAVFVPADKAHNDREHSRIDRFREAIRLEIRSIDRSASEIVDRITRIGDNPPPVRFSKVRR